MMPHPSWSTDYSRVCVIACVCVFVCPQGVYPGGYNAATYTGSDHSLFGAVCVCECICVLMCERVKGPMCPLILNINTLVHELHLLTLYLSPRKEEVRRSKQEKGGKEKKWGQKGKR